MPAVRMNMRIRVVVPQRSFRVVMMRGHREIISECISPGVVIRTTTVIVGIMTARDVRITSIPMSVCLRIKSLGSVEVRVVTCMCRRLLRTRRTVCCIVREMVRVVRVLMARIMPALRMNMRMSVRPRNPIQ